MPEYFWDDATKPSPRGAHESSIEIDQTRTIEDVTFNDQSIPKKTKSETHHG
jgi:hypothetical protein